MRAIERIIHFNAPRLLSGRRADCPDAAGTGTDKCGGHAAGAQNLNRSIDRITLGNPAQIKLYSFTVKTNRMRSIIEHDMFEADPGHHRFELTGIGHSPFVVEETPYLHEWTDGDVKSAARGST